MPDTLKLPPLARDMDAAAIEIRAEEGGPLRLKFPASSEREIVRWWGTELLRHDAKSIRLERAKGGAMPLLFNHRMDQAIGMIDRAAVEDGRLVVEAHLFETSQAQEVRKMLDGGLRNVSIGYEIHVVEEDVKKERYTATDWEPFEVSIVTVPADPSVGLGRALRGIEDAEKPVRITRAATIVNNAATPPKEKTMPEAISAAPTPAAPPAAVLNAVDTERERREAIISLARANNIDARIEEQWVRGGERFEDTFENGKLVRKGIARQIAEVIEERGKTKPSTAAAIGLSRSETQNYSLFRAIRALRFGGQNRQFVEDAGFEFECSQAVAKKLGRTLSSSLLVPAEILTRPVGAEAAQRTMTVVPGSTGGYMVGTDNLGFIDILRNRSVAMRMGARVLSGLQGNVTFARQTGKPSVTWQAGEAASVSAADQTLGQLSMTPKTCIAITDVSEQLLAQSSPSAEAFVMADLAANVAIDGVDAAVLNGTGGAQPLGIRNTTGITSGQDASSATYAKILAFVSTAGASNAILGAPGFVVKTVGAARLMQVQRFSSTDTPIWTGNMLDGQLVGFPAMSSEQAASGNIFFGSWGEVLIGEWGVLELSTDNGGTRFNNATVGIRAMWMVDTLIRYPQAFVVGTNLS